MPTISGIHHISAIAGPPQQNVDFYVGLLGLRLVKKTVNFDDPGTYHLYYGDYLGQPGTLLTFFPWSDSLKGRSGLGMATATAFSVSKDSLDFWMSRFADAAYEFQAPAERFGVPVLAFEAPDGLPLELIAHLPDGDVPRAPVPHVPAEHAIRSFHSATLTIAQPENTARLLIDTFGYAEVGEEDGRLRLQAPGDAHATVIDLLGPPAERSRMGYGTVHHIAFRAKDEEEQQAWREAVASQGYNVTAILDRQYFRSIYFREPGGVLFEIATDPPGFTKDEPLETLGTDLKLPPWLEPQRERIELRLLDLHLPTEAS